MDGVGRSIGVLGLVSSCLLVLTILAVVFLGAFDPGVARGPVAMWSVAYVAIGLLLYLMLQAAAALAHPPGRLTLLSFMDITLSVVPIIVAAIAVFMWSRGLLALSNFQVVVLTMVTVAAALDVIFFGIVMYVAGEDDRAKTR